ncbi:MULTISPECIES: dipeptidase [unclassified Tatumella]|uniref:dipeptidase n=1 Tax=unclassified Tatumella TaxID=2649542 RepID=UPI001BAEE218|nr:MULTISPECIES: dipeptidase [unclassified Tatumella]MBS0855081.1 dipeptidase [Tatumella sp. JGM16]MBS0876111.1 dipeptidase [Tatumella sp. JGM82]MBS0889159.1 dipeptidase [Tatumella sp. JGM94]MBS0892698.1 dipeptidase [Tatumella sp. JGM130]MBS0901041.1 dipeptidase [Tatumella sp. JGM100]
MNVYIDGHNDLLMQLWLKHPDNPEVFFFGDSGEGHLDFSRIVRGRLGAALFAIFVPPQSYVAQHFPGRLDALQDKVQVMWQQLAILQRLERYSDGKARICRTSAEVEYCLQHGILAMIAHIEGADALDTQGQLLQAFFQAGVRSVGPFWNTANAFGEGVTGRFPGSPDSGPGLTPHGIELIRQLQSLNMLTDVSHMNQQAFSDTARYSQQPLVATHSSAHALCPQPRNLTDQQLKMIADSGGIVGVNFGNAFIRPDGQRNAGTALSVITRHLMYLINVAGEEHVGFGSDFDGVCVPQALGDVAGLPLIEQSLRNEGVKERVIARVCYQNWLRIFKHFPG